MCRIEVVVHDEAGMPEYVVYAAVSLRLALSVVSCFNDESLEKKKGIPSGTGRSSESSGLWRSWAANRGVAFDLKWQPRCGDRVRGNSRGKGPSEANEFTDRATPTVRRS